MSPGINPRPSLSVVALDAEAAHEVGVAGDQPPTFVERWRDAPSGPDNGSCRRGSTPGLR